MRATTPITSRHLQPAGLRSVFIGRSYPASWTTCLLLSLLFSLMLWPLPAQASAQAEQSEASQSDAGRVAPRPDSLDTTENWNRRLRDLLGGTEAIPAASHGGYHIGPEDLLEISVFEATELNRSVRVGAGGEISLPLLGVVQAAGLTPRELELVLEELLRRTYMKDPHVGVFVREMQSHPVSVFGAVQKPGVFQIRGTKTLLEVLSMAEGLAEDAGDTVIVMRGPSLNEARARQASDPESPAQAGTPGAAATPEGEGSLEINLKELLESGEPRFNVFIYPGDIVKVPRAGIVYVVGEVRKPGGFVLKSNENISVLQAVALGEGLTRTAAKSRAVIIRTTEEGRIKIPLDLEKIFKGRAPDPILQPKDIVFVPNSAAKTALLEGVDAVVRTISGVIVFRR